jgi:hypothetical protein
MKNTLLICLCCLFASKAMAQQPITFDENGRATLAANLGPNSYKAYTVDGETFTSIAFLFKKLNGIQYTISIKNEVIYYGNTNGDVVQFNSDKNSIYTLKLYNPTPFVRGFIVGVVVDEELTEI